MTVLIVLAGLLISHFFTAVGRWRDFGWLLWPVREAQQRFPDQPVLVVVALMVTAIVLPLFAAAVLTALLGVFGWALLALIVFIYTLGPRDLDHDVAHLLEHPGHADAREAAAALGLRANAEGGAAAATVLHGARTRWFGTLFWFALLGIPGALLYRLCQQAMRIENISPGGLDWLARLRWVLEWPVLVTMILAAGLVADLDRVVQAWKRHHEDRPWWLVTPSLLDAVAAELLHGEPGQAEGLRRGHQLAWRMLVLWLVVLSLMLIAGWIV